jgi:2-polyprenyl-3-methyl-5-hydroxy-6-metoxy-1,4-benzoquinol methylase
MWSFADSAGQARWPLVECAGCGVLALHPQPTDEELAAAYSAEYYGASRRKFIVPIAALVGVFQGGRARVVARLLPRAARILDVGCGNGGFLMQMQRRGFSVEGTEWTAASAARVPRESGIGVHVGDLLDVHLPPQTFDAVTLWHVFEHLRQPDLALRKIRVLLRPEGRLLMSLPNAESAQAQRFGRDWFHHDPPRHLFGFGLHSLAQLLEDSGFRVEDINTFSLEQNPFGEIQSALNARGFPRDRLYTQLKGQAEDDWATRLGDRARMLALALPALVRSTIESLRGEGATMTVVARIAP